MGKNDNPLYLGIDLGGTNIEAGIVDAKGKVLVREETKTKAEGGAKAVLDRIVKVSETLLGDKKVGKGKVEAVGIGAPGAINIQTGTVIEAVNLGWSKYPLKKNLEKKLSLPVVVDNDVNVGTWGEYKAGAGRRHKSLMGIFVGTGIGGGFVLDGKLFHGHHFTAGEIGHTVLVANAALGRRTLENVASRTAIVNNLAALISSNQESLITELVDGDMSKVRSKVLTQALSQEDPLTVRVVGDAARYVGIAIANAVTLLSLDAVVVGGGLTEAMGGTFVAMVREAFDEHVFPAPLKRCKIVASTLGDDAGVIGAALLAREKNLEQDLQSV